MNKKYILRFLLGDILAILSIWLYTILINYSYNKTVPPTDFVHNLKLFLLTNFKDVELRLMFPAIFLLIVLLVDLLTMIFKGKSILKYTAITLLGVAVILPILLI